MVQASDHQVAELVTALYTAVRRAHRLRSTRVHSSCDKAGLVLLSQLAEIGPMRLSDLAGAVQLDPSTVSRQVRALCEGGFAEALDDPDDKRARLLEISEKGRAEVAAVSRELAEILGRAVTGWPKADVEKLTALLTRLADGLPPDGPPPDAPPAPAQPRAEAQPPTQALPAPRADDTTSTTEETAR